MDTESLKTDGHRFESCSVRLPKTLKGTRGWSPGSFSYLPVLLASSAGPMQDHVQVRCSGNSRDSSLFHIEVSDSSLSPAAIGIRFISVFLYSDLPASAISVRIRHSKVIVRDFQDKETVLLSSCPKMGAPSAILDQLFERFCVHLTCRKTACGFELFAVYSVVHSIQLFLKIPGISKALCTGYIFIFFIDLDIIKPASGRPVLPGLIISIKCPADLVFLTLYRSFHSRKIGHLQHTVFDYIRCFCHNRERRCEQGDSHNDKCR